MNVLFYQNERQEELAMVSKERLISYITGKFFRRKIYTQILPASTFYLAEDYHQKYLLQKNASLMSEFRAIYPNFMDLVNSTAVARVNGYLGRNGTRSQLESELASLGLSPVGQQQLLAVEQRIKR